MTRAVALLMAAGTITLMGQNSEEPPQWRDWIEQGAVAFRYARYAEAIAAFQKASDSNPKSPIPHLYLALGWLQQYIPGAVFADNADHARLAETALRRALTLDPKNWTAVVLLGMSARNENRPEQALEWYRKAVALQPRNADIWCTLGALGLQQWLRLNKPADRIEEAILDFEKSVEVDPVHDSAMQYLSIMLRERASLRHDDEERRKDLAAADGWRERAANVRAEKVQAEIEQAVIRRPDVGDPDPLLRSWESLAVMVPPPPPPPPPRSGGGMAAGFANDATIVFEPQVQSADPVAPPILVAPAVQAQKLVTQADPEFAADGQAESQLRFVVVIGKDGRIVREILIDGSPWLKQSAVGALRRWVYEPTLRNGKPVEVVTEVRVEFRAIP
jgi:hypothetical protein